MLPSEDTFVSFLRLRKVPIHAHPNPVIISNDQYFDRVREILLSDRGIYTKGIRAFVSFLKSYKEHQLTAIFRLKDLDLKSCARGFFLLRLPRCPELKQVTDYVDQITPEEEKNIKFRDSKLELLRQKRIEAAASDIKLPFRKKVEKWSKQKEKVAKRLIKTEKKDRKRRVVESKCIVLEEDIDAINDETRLMKKFKRGKITEAEFDVKMDDFSIDILEDNPNSINIQ